MAGQVVASSVHSTGTVLIRGGCSGVNADLMVWQNGPKYPYCIYFDWISRERTNKPYPATTEFRNPPALFFPMK